MAIGYQAHAPRCSVSFFVWKEIVAEYASQLHLFIDIFKMIEY